MQTISHEKETLGVVDETGVVLPILKERYSDYIIKDVINSEEARQLLENNNISSYIIIPSDFLKVWEGLLLFKSSAVIIFII